MSVEHVDDWLDDIGYDPLDRGMAYAKWVLEYHRLPAWKKTYYAPFMADHKVFCTFKGERWRCIGAAPTRTRDPVARSAGAARRSVSGRLPVLGSGADEGRMGRVGIRIGDRAQETAMTNDEVLRLPGRDNPTLCADGLMGMLITFPSATHPMAGIQVHGEEDIRWISPADLEATPEGALRQVGAPQMPKAPQEAPVPQVQLMLAMRWAKLGFRWVLT